MLLTNACKPVVFYIHKETTAHVADYVQLNLLASQLVVKVDHISLVLHHLLIVSR